MQKSIKRIAIAGSGNVAWHLAKGLKSKNYDITGVWSRDFSHALTLAESCSSMPCKDISNLCDDADLIIIAVADKAIKEVASAIGKFEGIVVHTAGSIAMEILKDFFENCGVFYPLQTFTKGIPVNLNEVTFFLESSSDEVFNALNQVSLTLSGKTYHADSQQRMLLHVAAVYASNYSNLMYIIGNELLKNTNLPQSVLHNLIKETARKAITSDPLTVQTGPARRNDTLTIEKHIKTLASFPEYAELYRMLANLITNKYK